MRWTHTTMNHRRSSMGTRQLNRAEYCNPKNAIKVERFNFNGSLCYIQARRKSLTILGLSIKNTADLSKKLQHVSLKSSSITVLPSKNESNPHGSCHLSLCKRNHVLPLPIHVNSSDRKYWRLDFLWTRRSHGLQLQGRIQKTAEADADNPLPYSSAAWENLENHNKYLSCKFH